MRDGRSQFNMGHPLAPDLGQGHFNTAFFADHTAVLQSLVLTAKAFVVLDRSKYLGAEQPVTLRLEGAVVNRLRLFYFTIRPGPDLVRRGKADGNRVKLLFLRYLLKQIKQCFHFSLHSG